MTNSLTPSHFLRKLNSIRVPDFETLKEKVLAFKATGCKKSHDYAVQAFLPMVYKMASGRRGITEVDDLFQYGAMAVMDALRMYDPNEPLNIVSWTKVYVVREMNRRCLFQNKLVRVPETKTIRLCYRRMGGYLNSGPLTETRCRLLADELGVSLEDFRIARDLYCSSYESINQDEGEEGPARQFAAELTLEEEVIIQDEAHHVTQTVSRLMKTLNPREAEVIRLRCLQDDPVQLRIVGEQLGVSTERARQVENNALKKMRQAA